VFPAEAGGQDSPATYWDFLMAGGDALMDITDDRWLADKFYAPRSTVRSRKWVAQEMHGS
jgi:acyl transferase domain-containing protein